MSPTDTEARRAYLGTSINCIFGPIVYRALTGELSKTDGRMHASACYTEWIETWLPSHAGGWFLQKGRQGTYSRPSAIRQTEERCRSYKGQSGTGMPYQQTFTGNWTHCAPSRPGCLPYSPMRGSRKFCYRGFNSDDVFFFFFFFFFF